MSAVEVEGYEEVPDAVLFAGADHHDEHHPELGVVRHQHLVDNHDVSPSIPDSFDDANVADVLAEHLRGRWLYVAAWARWLGWDGTRWATDECEQVHEDARRWVLELVATVARVGASSDDVKRAAGYRNRFKLDAALTMARRIEGIAAAPSEFDAHHDLLNVANGVVDLQTGNLRDHDPHLRMTKLAPVDYRPGAYHRDVGEILKVVEPDVLPYLRRILGYACTGHTSEDIAVVADGSGANGKSTLLEGIGAVLGDYAGAVSPQLVMRTNHEPHPTIKADLLGKRLVWISETEEGGAFRMEQVKALTGGDQISARFMRADFFTFTPTHTLIIATNHRPAVNSTEYASWRRLRLIPFPYTYLPAHDAQPGDRVQDRHLRRRLTTGNAQRESLLAWLIDGAIDWYRTGLGTSVTVEQAGREWRRAEDVILRFIEEHVTFDPERSTKGSVLYEIYRDWCNAEGRKPKSNKNFAAEFMAHETVKAGDVTKTTPQGSTRYGGIDVHVGVNF